MVIGTHPSKIREYRNIRVYIGRVCRDEVLGGCVEGVCPNNKKGSVPMVPHDVSGDSRERKGEPYQTLLVVS